MNLLLSRGMENKCKKEIHLKVIFHNVLSKVIFFIILSKHVLTMEWIKG